MQAKIYKPGEAPLKTYKVVRDGCKRARCIIKGTDEDEAWEKFVTFHLGVNEKSDDFEIYQI